MNLLAKIFPLLVLVALTILFFGKTLTGNQIFVTPDFGGSDILSIEYPTKLFMAESLKGKRLPLWNSQVAAGFPQIGFPSGLFNPVNLFLFYLLPTPLAYNWGLAAIFLTTALFTYLFARSLGLSKTASLLSAASFSFSGIFVTQLVHYSVIQTLSLFPLELYLAETALQKRRRSWAVLLAFVIGIQILIGFFQIVVYSLIVLAFYTLWRTFFGEEKLQMRALVAFVLFLSFFFGFLIAAVQLLPSWEFTQHSNRQQGVSLTEIKLFPYPPQHLVTFIWPYLLGDPRIGTYPPFSPNWGIFWENTGFIGVVPLILSLLAILWGTRKSNIIKFFLILAIFSLLLMLGKNSPTFFLFHFPPLSFFRVPARWIIFFTFSLTMLAGFGWDIARDKLEGKIASPKFKALLNLLILVIISASLFLFAFTYHLRGDTDKWLKETETARFLKNDQSIYRIISLGNERVWNQQFLKKGWLGAEEKYWTFREALDPNWNVVQGINQAQAYGILLSRRNIVLQTLTDQNIEIGKEVIIVGEVAHKLLDLQNIKYLVSPIPIKGRDFERVFQSQTQPPYFIYQNKTVLPRVFMVKNGQWSPTFRSQLQALSLPKFDPKTIVILEKNLQDRTFNLEKFQAKITKYGHQNVEIEVETDGDGILVLADAFFPGWKATVDDQKAEILAANVNQRALVINKGKHLIKFEYDPQSFKIGAIISLSAVIVGILLFSWLRFKRL